MLNSQMAIRITKVKTALICHEWVCLFGGGGKSTCLTTLKMIHITIAIDITRSLAMLIKLSNEEYINSTNNHFTCLCRTGSLNENKSISEKIKIFDTVENKMNKKHVDFSKEIQRAVRITNTLAPTAQHAPPKKIKDSFS